MKHIHNQNLFRQQCYINRKWIDANNKKTFPVFNPYDAQLLGHVPACGEEETQQAILAAETAWKSWRALTAKQRADYLWRWADLIAKNSLYLLMQI